MTLEEIKQRIQRDENPLEDIPLLLAVSKGLKADTAENSFRNDIISALDASNIDATEFFRAVIAEENRNALYVTTSSGKTQAVKKLQPITAAALDARNIEALEMIVADMLPVGLAMLGAPSKYFKSYMALDLCAAVCSGTGFLGHKTKRHACVYFDLESTQRRPRDRLRQMYGDKPKPENLYIITAMDGVSRIGDGFEAQFSRLLEEHPDIKLAVIDVFQLVRQPATAKQTGYDRDYADMKALKQLADKNNICMLLVHHTRKMKDPSDVFNELSGSVGIIGALDAVWLITKKQREDNEAVLHITGRDLQSLDLSIEFDRQRMRWTYQGTAEEVEAKQLMEDYEASPVIATIKKLVAQNGGSWTGSAADIKDASVYMGSRIYTDAKNIGKEINRFEALLSFDNISFNYQRTGHNRNRKYVFIMSA